MRGDDGDPLMSAPPDIKDMKKEAREEDDETGDFVDFPVKEVGFGLDGDQEEDNEGGGRTGMKNGKIWRVPGGEVNGRPEFRMSCPECGKVCGDLPSHFKSRHKGLDWRGIKTPCPYEDCEKVVVDIQNHIRLVHLKIKNFECDHCDAKFSNRYQVRNHINGVHSSIREKCPHCDQMLKVTTLKTHIKNIHEGGGQRVWCKEEDCPKSFQSNADLERHVVSVHMKIKAPCPECGRKFRMETLANHIKTQHKGIYPFRCDECGKGFQSTGQLHTHTRTRHYGVFLYCKCITEKGEICGKRLYTDEGLQKHIERVHLKKEEGQEIPCPQCDKMVLPSSLQRHVEEAHLKITRKTCPVFGCDEIFSNKYTLQSHVSIVHDQLANKDWCDLCEEYKQDLKGHYKLVHTDHDQLPCTWPKCNYRGKTKQLLEKHIKYVHQKKTRTSCTECGKSVRDLLHHVRVFHRKEKLHFCNECDKGFPTKSQLRSHIDKIHLKIRKSCPDCGAEVANLQQHIRFVHEKRMVAVCDVPGCETKFANNLAKKNHMKTVHEGHRETCPECGKQVTVLRSHMRIVHEKRRPHTCPDCAKTFQSKSHLRNHITRVHLQIKVKCEDCGALVQDIKNHRTFVHMGVKNFPCDQCETRCITSTALKMHIESVHLKIRVPCEICNAEVVPSALKKHVRSHVKTEEEKSPHKCQECGRGYPTPGALRKHVMRVHLEFREECPKCGLQTKDLYRHMRMTQCDRPGYIVRQQKNRNSLDGIELGIVKQEPGYNNNTVMEEKPEMEQLQQEEETEVREKGFWLEKEESGGEGSVSSGGFNGFPSDVEEWGGGGSKDGRNSRQEEVLSSEKEGRSRRKKVSKIRGGSGRSSVASVAGGSDSLELGDSDGFFASEEESEVMKKIVEPIPITDVEGDADTCDPLDVSSERKPRGRGKGRGKRKWNTVIYSRELESIDENDTKEIKEEGED